MAFLCLLSRYLCVAVYLFIINTQDDVCLGRYLNIFEDAEVLMQGNVISTGSEHAAGVSSIDTTNQFNLNLNSRLLMRTQQTVNMPTTQYIVRRSWLNTASIISASTGHEEPQNPSISPSDLLQTLNGIDYAGLSSKRESSCRGPLVQSSILRNTRSAFSRMMALIPQRLL